MYIYLQSVNKTTSGNGIFSKPILDYIVGQGDVGYQVCVIWIILYTDRYQRETNNQLAAFCLLCSFYFGSFNGDSTVQGRCPVTLSI